MNTVIWWYLQTAATAACLIPFILAGCRLFRNRPAVQHVLWLVVLIKLLTPSFLVWPVDLNDLQAILFPNRAEHPGTSTALITEASPVPAAATLPSAATVLAAVLLTVWVVGALVVSARQIQRLGKQSALVRRGTRAPAELVDAVRAVAARWHLGFVPVFVVRGIASPFVWCLGRLKLVWPQHAVLAELASPSIIAHELAHVVRRDHWVAWLELVASVLWWWNPVYWMVRRNLRSTSEMACDALALSAFPEDRCRYAETLLELSAGSTNGVPVLVLGAGTGTPSSLERRLSMIVSARASGKLSWTGMLLSGLFALVALPGWSQGSPRDDDDDLVKKKIVLKKKMQAEDDAASLAAAIKELAEAGRQGNETAAQKLLLIKELLAAKNLKNKGDAEKMAAEKRALVEFEKAKDARRKGQDADVQKIELFERMMRDIEGPRLDNIKRKRTEQEQELFQRKKSRDELQAVEAELAKLRMIKEKLAEAAADGDDEVAAKLKALHRKLTEVEKKRVERDRDKE